MLWVHDRLAGVVVGCSPRRGEILLARLGRHDEHFSAERGDLGQEPGQGREIRHAEGAPVAAEVWLCICVRRVLSRRIVGDGRREKESESRTNHLDEFVISNSVFILGDRMGGVRRENHFWLIVDVAAG